MCFRYAAAGGDLDRPNADIVADLQEAGIAAPSTTTIGGRLRHPGRDRQPPHPAGGHRNASGRGAFGRAIAKCASRLSSAGTRLHNQTSCGSWAFTSPIGLGGWGCAHSSGTARRTSAATRVPDPEIEDPRDAIIKVTSCAICGSDLHLFDDFMPGMKPGDIMGHEIMGEVVEVGSGVNEQAQGRRPRRRAVHDHLRRMRAVPARQFLGLRAHQPQQGPRRQGVRPHHRGAVRLHAPDRRLSRRPGRISCACRLPTSTHIKVPDGLTDEQVLFLGDIFPTGWQAAVQCDIEPTDTVAIWGCGPVGQMAIRSAILLGAKQVIAIDRLPERLSMARGRRRDHDQLRRGERRRAAERADRRQGPGEVHRRGRHGGARRPRRIDSMLRPRQADGDAGDRPAARAARDDLCLPPGRHRSRSPASMAACSTRSRSAR